MLTSDGFQLSALSGNCTRLKRVAKPNVRPAFQGSLHLRTGKGYKCSVLLPQLGTTLQAISASELPWGQLRSLLRWQNGSASLSAQFCLLPCPGLILRALPNSALHATLQLRVCFSRNPAGDTLSRVTCAQYREQAVREIIICR